MNLEEFVAVSGLPGVYKMAVNRNNGLIVENLDDGKRKFVPARKHQFTSLASIGIYTEEDTEELNVIFRTMLEQVDSNPPVKHNASRDEIVTYFESILPNYDRDRVFLGDMKKVIKWFTFLNDRNKLSLEEAPVADAAQEEE